MDYLTKCSEAAGEVNALVASGKRAEANDLLMFRAEQIAKQTGNRYSDTKQAIFFAVQS